MINKEQKPGRRGFLGRIVPAALLRGAALLLGFNALIWGVVALCPGSMFSTSSVYVYYEDYAPEWVWGLGFALAGLCQIARVTRGGFFAWLAAVLLSAGFGFAFFLLISASTASATGYITAFYFLVQSVYTIQIDRGGDDGK